MVAISELEVWTVIEGGCISLNVKQIVWSGFRGNNNTIVAADLLHNM